MRVSFFSESVVVLFEVRVALDGNSCPMMQRVVERQRAGPPHDDLSPFTALFGDRGDASQASKSVEISQTNGIMSVAEESSEDDGAHAGQRGEDGGVTRRAGLESDLLEPAFEVLVELAPLSTNE